MNRTQIEIELPTALAKKIRKTQKPTQTFDDRLNELIRKGIDTDKARHLK